MAPSYSDRRRFLLATVLTLIALPALWWANRSEESAAPNVAVVGAGVGVDVGAAHDSDRSTDGAGSTSSGEADVAAGTTGAALTEAPTAPTPDTVAAPTTAAPTTGAPVPAVERDQPGSLAPVYLDGPSSNIGAGLSQIAVPAKPTIERIRTKATFRNSIGGSSACGVPGVINARSVTIVNLDNGHSVTCTTVVQRGELGDEVVLHTDLFAQLADLTDAPIHVEIRR